MIESWKDILTRGLVPKPEVRVHMESPDAIEAIGQALVQTGVLQWQHADQIVVVCIGSDRSIGDALGPLVGTYMTENEPEGFTVLGTLDNPVHAGNLMETLEWIEGTFRRPFVIAVDACLGRLDSIGTLIVNEGSLRPGAGVNKSLPAVGDVHLTGVVNVSGFMEYFVLQNTRLSLVMRMARVAASGLKQGLNSLVADRSRLALSD